MRYRGISHTFYKNLVMDKFIKSLILLFLPFRTNWMSIKLYIRSQLCSMMIV